jgi:hypothetical protein
VKFGDLSPPSVPSREQQRDALQKGFGRAMQWAHNECLADEPLLEACILDRHFDVQVEQSRDDWLWSMMQVVRATERFRTPILQALHELSDEHSANRERILRGHRKRANADLIRPQNFNLRPRGRNSIEYARKTKSIGQTFPASHGQLFGTHCFMSRLNQMESAVRRVAAEKFIGASLFDDLAVLENDYRVGHADCG